MALLHSCTMFYVLNNFNLITKFCTYTIDCAVAPATLPHSNFAGKINTSPPVFFGHGLPNISGNLSRRNVFVVSKV